MPERRPLLFPERAALALAAGLLALAICGPPLWKALDPALHARWWFVWGGPGLAIDSDSPPRQVASTETPFALASPLPADVIFLPEPPPPLGLGRPERWLEVQTWYEQETGSSLRRSYLETRKVGFEAPPTDPWGSPWRREGTFEGFPEPPENHLGSLDGDGIPYAEFELTVDPYSNRPRDTEVYWSLGPNGRWDEGRRDDVPLDGSMDLAITALARAPALLLTLAATLALAVLLARALPRSRSLKREALAVLAIAGALLALTWTLGAEPLRDLLLHLPELRALCAHLLLPPRVAATSSAALLVLLLALALRLPRRAASEEEGAAQRPSESPSISAPPSTASAPVPAGGPARPPGA
ncbi:MAG: hypothetical protein AB7N76_32795 [Planctomycetota bacterium]